MDGLRSFEVIVTVETNIVICYVNYYVNGHKSQMPNLHPPPVMCVFAKIIPQVSGICSRNKIVSLKAIWLRDVG